MIFAGAGVLGWMASRRATAAPPVDGVGALLAVAMLAYAPSQYRTVHRELAAGNSPARKTIQNELLALVADHQINLGAAPWASPTTRPCRCSPCT